MGAYEAAAWWAARLDGRVNLLAGRTVLTLGTFDALHVGHMELLGACRVLAGDAGRVVVALNRDGFVERFKGHRPLIAMAHRSEMLRACRWVDVVLVNTGDEDSRPVIEAVQPDVIAIGADWQDRDYLGQLGVDQDWLDARAIRVEYVPRTRGESTTAIRLRAVPA